MTTVSRDVSGTVTAVVTILSSGTVQSSVIVSTRVFVIKPPLDESTATTEPLVMGLELPPARKFLVTTEPPEMPWALLPLGESEAMVNE
jgi:hypothetical protein